MPSDRSRTSSTSPSPSTSPSTSPTKQQRREQAREQAREARARAERSQRRQRRAVVGALLLAVVALVVVTAFALARSRAADATAADVVHPDPSPSLAAVAVPRTAEADTGGVPVSAAGVGVVGEGVRVDIYLDAMCPWCGVLERAHAADVAELVAQGGVTVVYHPLAILDDASAGTAYSTRAANAMGVVADRDPDRFAAFVTALFAEGTQPQEGSSGLSDAALGDVAREVGVPDDVADDFTAHTAEGRTFAGWAAAANTLAPRDDQGRVTTPTILIDGERWTGDFRVPGSLGEAITAAAS